MAKITNKILRGFYIDPELFKQFKTTTTILNKSHSDVIAELIRDYVIRSKAEVNEIILGNSSSIVNEIREIWKNNE
jgi:hypothetical protein